MLVARVRFYLLKKKKTLKEAIDLAIKDCINEGKIAEFLESHSEEVKDMLLREWKLEDELEGQLSDGIEIGMRRVAINMLKKGMSVDEISELTGLFIDDILRLEC